MINLTNNTERKYVCKVDMAFEAVRGKWKSIVICNLSTGRKRFTELQKITTGISHKVLNEKLKELEVDGLISKEIFYEYPPRVEYFLTSKGYEYARVIKQLEDL
ncbi:MAG: helix-turn-helix domain-containing protein [Terrisporobacter sp.]